MATKYQCEKAIRQLLEKGSEDSNIQGYGIGRAKDYGVENKGGYVVLVYTETAPEKITPVKPLEEKPPKKKKVKVNKAKPTTTKKAKKKVKPTKAEKPEKKPEAEQSGPVYPDKVETTSRKKKVQVALEYIETGKFGFS